MSGFTQVKVRAAAPLVSRAAETATSVSASLTKRSSVTHKISTSLATIADPTDRASSGLTPVEVGVTLAILFGAFVMVLAIGLLCKVFNKPTAEAAPYVGGKLYQPSAAGYGSRSVMGRADPMGTPNFSSRVSLLHNAGPMGYVGGSELAGDLSMASNDSRDAGDTSASRGHGRGHSSGIQLPGATAVASRKGISQGARHPAPLGTNGIAPDGSGFAPSFNSLERRPSQASTSAMPLGASAANQLPPHARVGMGPPPAADARRRSRYARGASKRIDSMGPGTLRKSMYMGMEDDAMNAENYDRRTSRMSRKFSENASQGLEVLNGSNNLRRVDSVGKGDHRRRSMARTSYRGASIYSQNGTSPAGGGGDRALLRSAQADNFGAGRRNGDTSDGSIDPLRANKGGYLRAPNTGRGRSGSVTSQGNEQGLPRSPSNQYSSQSSPGSQHSNASLISSPGQSFGNANGAASPYATPVSTPNSAAQAAAAASGGYFGNPASGAAAAAAARTNRPRPGMAGGYTAAPYPAPQLQVTTGPSAGRQII